MAKYRISHDAQADIVDILRFTHNRFGDAARRRYQALIGAALEAVATDPLRLGSLSREEEGPGLRSIHLVYCRSMPKVGKVIRPRHFVFYRVAADQVLEVVRVLHDSMDLDRHLPPNEQTLQEQMAQRGNGLKGEGNGSQG